MRNYDLIDENRTISTEVNGIIPTDVRSQHGTQKIPSIIKSPDAMPVANIYISHMCIILKEGFNYFYSEIMFP